MPRNKSSLFSKALFDRFDHGIESTDTGETLAVTLNDGPRGRRYGYGETYHWSLFRKASIFPGSFQSLIPVSIAYWD